MTSTSLLARRAFLAGLGASTFAAPALAQQAVIQPEEGYREVFLGEELLSWLDAYGRPTAKVMIGDKGPFDFLVDTGSNTTVLPMMLALEAGATFVGSSIVHGTTGSAEMPMALLPELSTGSVKRRDIRVAVFPNENFGHGHGILGADVFAGRRLTFDIPARSVRVDSSRRDNGSIAPVGNLRMRNGMLAELRGRVGRVRTRLMLDTGAQQGIINPALNAALARYHPELKRAERVRVTGVTGHVLYGDLVFLPRAEMGTMELLDASAVAADAPIFKVWGLEKDPAMIVGVDVLSRMQGFSIDYGTRRFEGRPLAMMAKGDSFSHG